MEKIRPGSRSPGEAVLLISASGSGVRDVGLTHLAGPVLQSRPSHLMPAMNSFTRPTRLIFPPRAAFWPETGPSPRKTPPPFRSGAALDAAGAEFPLPGASLAVAGASLRQMVAPPFGAGAEFRRSGAPMHGAGAAVRRSGAAPISCADAPAARSDATIARNGHPAPRGVGHQSGPHSPLCGSRAIIATASAHSASEPMAATTSSRCRTSSTRWMS